MNFPKFIFKIRDETGRHEEELLDFKVVVRQKTHHRKSELPVEDVTIDHEQKKIYIWVD